MYSEEDIHKIVGKFIDIDKNPTNPAAFRHISNMLIEIQDFLIYKNPKSKFIELCANRNWERAIGIADDWNREMLKDTTLYQDFVRVVSRESNINNLLKED